MSWLTNYRQASFRNVPFFVNRTENEGGRRAAVHEFPKQDTPYTEDMGRKARRFSIDGYVLGDDYFSSRNKLIEALEKTGSGKLIHPYLGTLIVVCVGYRLSETVDEGRMARFSMEFTEAGEALFPSAVLNTRKNTQTAKKNAYGKVKESFISTYSIASVPYTESQRALSTVNQVFSLIDEAKRSVSAVAAFQRDLENAQGRSIELTYLAEDLIDEILGLLTFGTDPDDEEFEATADNARQQIQELYKFLRFLPAEGLTSISSPSASVCFAVQQAAVSAIGGLLALVEFDSINEAQSYQTVFLNELDRIIQQDISDDLYTALMDLRTAVMTDIARRATALPRVVEYTPNVAVPALVLSWALYGTNNKEQDIIDRNNIQHPGFAPGAVPLKLLSYV